jgi:hypothetical protein
MDLNQFKNAKDPNSEFNNSGIFKYNKLTFFEKVLFLEYNVRELIKLLKRKDSHIKSLEEQLQRSIDNYEESQKIKDLKNTVFHNERIIKKYKDKIRTYERANKK